MFTQTVKKLATVLEIKGLQKLKFLKNDNNKKPSSKLMFFNEEKNSERFEWFLTVKSSQIKKIYLFYWFFCCWPTSAKLHHWGHTNMLCCFYLGTLIADFSACIGERLFNVKIAIKFTIIWHATARFWIISIICFHYKYSPKKHFSFGSLHVTHCLDMSYYVNFWGGGGLGSNEFQLK